MARAKPKFQFSKQFQTELVRIMFQFPEESREILERIEAPHFDTATSRWTVSKMQKLLGSTGVPATYVMLEHEAIKDAVAGIIPDTHVEVYARYLKRLKRAVPSKTYVLDEAFEYIKFTSLRELVISTGESLQSGKLDWKQVQQDLDAQRQLGERLDGGLGQDFFEDASSRVERRKSYEAQGVPTGLPIDSKFRHGGLPPKQLGVIMAPPGRGKTLVLVFLSGSGILAGHNVLFVSTELDEDMISERHDARFTGISLSKLVGKPKTVQKRLRAIAASGGGQLRVKFFPPNALTLEALRLYLKRLEASAFYPSLVVIDYADNMSLSEFGGRAVDSDYGPLGRLYIGLRGIAGEFNVPIWTASQTNRAGVDKKHIGMQDLADSFRKAAVADVLAAIAQTKKERIRRVARILISKNRNGPVDEDGHLVRFDAARVSIS